MDETKTNAGDAHTARREEWRRIIGEQQASGQKAAVFCREHGISAWQFHYWRKAFSGDGASSGGFVQMKVRAAREATAQVWVEVGRWRVCVASDFDAATLRRAVEALAAL